MSKHTLVLALLFLSGCLARVEDAPEPSGYAPCPVVECRWSANEECVGATPAGSPNTFSSQQSYYDSGVEDCWLYSTACFPQGTRPECIPDECRRDTLTCYPKQP